MAKASEKMLDMIPMLTPTLDAFLKKRLSDLPTLGQQDNRHRLALAYFFGNRDAVKPRHADIHHGQQNLPVPGNLQGTQAVVRLEKIASPQHGPTLHEDADLLAVDDHG